jgi:dynein heavy chain 2
MCADQVIDYASQTQALIVTEFDGLEPLLYPLLRRDLSRSGPRAVVAIGEAVATLTLLKLTVLAARHPGLSGQSAAELACEIS